MAPLDRAVALAENGDAAAVPEELRLDVARALEVTLAEHRAVAERGLRLAAGGRKRLVELGRRSARRACRGRRRRPAALTTSGKPISSGAPWGSVGTPASRAIRFAASLSPPSRSASGRRADPGEAGRDDLLGEVGALGEEAVAGVDRVGAGLERRPARARRVEVGRDLDASVGRPRVQRAEVVGRDDGDGLDPEPRAGAEDAERDLSAICDEEPCGSSRADSMRRCCIYPDETSATETSAQATPTYCSRESRSRRTNAASRTVVTG